MLFVLCCRRHNKLRNVGLIWLTSVAAWFGRRGMPPPAANDTGTALGQNDWDCWRDLATLTFDLGGHGACGWCRSSSSIRVPSLKFVGLAVRKIWCTMYVSINGPGDFGLWPFDLETGTRVASKVGNLHCEFGQVRPSFHRVIRYVRDGWTNRRTDGEKQSLLPLLYGRGHNNSLSNIECRLKQWL